MESISTNRMLDKNRIREDVPCARIPDDYEIVPVSFLTLRINQSKLQNKVLHLKILSCTMGGVNMLSSRMTIMNSSQFGARKQKLMGSSTKTYNRFFLVADLASPPHCAAIMTKSITETSAILKLLYGNEFIGVDFYLLEPDLTFQTIGGSLPVLSFISKPMLPLKEDNSISQQTKMRLPAEVGETSYFINEGIKVSFHRIHVPVDVSCGGLQCDRQKPKGECSCVHNGSATTAMVYAFDVQFPIPHDLGLGLSEYNCHKFRSLKTTGVFFEDFIDYCSRTTVEEEELNLMERRKKMAEIVDIVNRNGGWKIVGWSKRGEIADAANEHERVENIEVTIHLTYLFPQNQEVFHLEAYKRSVITI